MITVFIEKSSCRSPYVGVLLDKGKFSKRYSISNVFTSLVSLYLDLFRRVNRFVITMDTQPVSACVYTHV